MRSGLPNKYMTLKNLFSTLLFHCACVCLLPSHAAADLDQDVKAATLVQLEQPSPDFTCRTTDGKDITLSTLRGKVVVLYFFSTASVPACVSELKILEQTIFQPLHKRDDFVFIAIGRKHTREELVKIGGENKLTFPLAPDLQQEIFGHYFTKFVPRKIVVRKDGSIAYHASGQQDVDGMLRLLAVLERELTVKGP